MKAFHAKDPACIFYNMKEMSEFCKSDCEGL